MDMDMNKDMSLDMVTYTVYGNIDTNTWTWTHGNEHSKIETWKWTHGNRHTNMDTWKWTHEHGLMDMGTWAWALGHGHLDMDILIPDTWIRP